jgi:hypothetical protein
VPLSNSVPRGFGFVHHSIAFLYHQVPNPISRFATFSSQYDGAAFKEHAADHEAGGVHPATPRKPSKYWVWEVMELTEVCPRPLVSLPQPPTRSGLGSTRARFPGFSLLFVPELDASKTFA